MTQARRHWRALSSVSSMSRTVPDRNECSSTSSICMHACTSILISGRSTSSDPSSLTYFLIACMYACMRAYIHIRRIGSDRMDGGN